MTVPAFRRLSQSPIDCEHLFEVLPPVVSPDGLTASHVVAGVPMESWMGPDYGIQVFAADVNGRVIDWLPVWDARAGVDLSPADWPSDWRNIVCGSFSGMTSPVSPTPTDQQLRSKLAAAQRQIQSLKAEIGIMSNAYHALSKHADEARIRERLEAKELEVTRLELDLAKARSELEILSAAYGDLACPPGKPPGPIGRARLAWTVLTGARTPPPPTP